jgi:hypothetical protein
LEARATGEDIVALWISEMKKTIDAEETVEEQ